MAPVIPAKRFPYHYTISHPPVKRAALRPQADPPRRSAPKGCAGTWVVPGVGGSRGREVVTPLARLQKAILRFGQNAVRTPGRTHVNDCVSEGVKFRAALFKGLGVAHVPEGLGVRAAPWSPSAEGEILLYGVSISAAVAASRSATAVGGS